MSYCEEIRDEWSDFVAGEVPEERRRAMESHASECAECARLLGEHRRVWDLLGAWQVAEPTPNRKAFAEPTPRYGRFVMGLAAAAAVLVVIFFILPATAHRRRVDHMMTFIRPEAATVFTLAEGRRLEAGDEVSTAPGEIADLRLPDGSTLLFSPETQFHFGGEQEGLRLAGELSKGRSELQTEPGLPVRIALPGGYAETLGTRLMLEAAESPTPHVRRIARAQVLDGQALVFDGTEKHTLEAGQSRVLTEFAESGELYGTAVQAAARRLVEGEFPAVKFEARGAGRTWIHARERRELPGPGQSVRLRFEERGGALWVSSWDPWDGHAPENHCREDILDAFDFDAPPYISEYRTLSLTEDPDKAINAAGRLAFEKDPFAAPRIDRARRRMAAPSPLAAAELESLLTNVPAAPGEPLPVARPMVRLPIWAPSEVRY